MADEPVKVQIMGRVDTNYPDSYRVKEDYEKEQKEARERHAMLQEQHRVLLRSYQANLVLAAATVLVAVATCALVFLTYRTTGYKPTSTTQFATTTIAAAAISSGKMKILDFISQPPNHRLDPIPGQPWR